MKTGLYFGSYNPVHIGHMAIANWLVEFTDLDEIWFVVSPQNPFKKKNTLLDFHHRLELVERAIGDDLRFRASDIESKMPQPSYTIDTVTWLREKHPGRDFALIMGSDNIVTIRKWKNIEQLITLCDIVVYPRKDDKRDILLNVDYIPEGTHVQWVDAPLIEISGTFIREAVAQGKDIRHLLPEKAWTYLDEMNFYR